MPDSFLKLLTPALVLFLGLAFFMGNNMLDWFTKNSAESRHFYWIPESELRQKVINAIKNLDGWELIDDEKITATRRTKIFRFIDDIEISIKPVGDGSTLDIKSASRIGIGDMGQNRRNIEEFLGGLEAELKP